jgi:hypothetical protein
MNAPAEEKSSAGALCFEAAAARKRHPKMAGE